MLVFLVSESKCNTHNICKNIIKDYPKESFGWKKLRDEFQ